MPTLKLRTHTPVAIGAGNSLSRLTDFIVRESSGKGKTVQVLDEERFQGFLEKNNQAFKVYEQVIFQGSSQDKNTTLHDLEKHIGGIDGFEKYSIEADRKVTGRYDIQAVIKNAGQHPYLPGSSIKGGIKTALLHQYLTNTRQGEKVLREISSKINFKEELKKKVKEAEKVITASSKSFTKLSNDGSKLGVSDSDLLSTDDLKIRRLERYNLNNGKTVTPQEWESVNPEVETSIALKAGSQSVDDILSAIQVYSLDATDQQIRLLEKLGNGNNSGIHEALLNFFTDIHEQLQQGRVFMRIGFGKGFFFNSIGPAFQNVYGHDGLRTLLRLNKVQNAEQFPITQVIDSTNNLPLGWVEIEKA
jgi:CRISPR-associated protein Csm5